MFLLKILLYLISILISFSFLTLYERKIIALSQIRLSPQINILMGISQPLIDALKLLTKSFSMNEEKFFMNKLITLCSYLMFFMYFHFWMVTPLSSGESFNSSLSMMNFLALLSVSLYFMMFVSFFSFSKFPFLSLLRSVSQSISYEINFSLMILILIFTFKILNLSLFNFLGFNFLFQFILFFLFLSISIIESFRSPFDFSESESELVSGFSSEVGSMKFIFIFMSEYMIMVFYITLMVTLVKLSMMTMFMMIYFFMFSRSVLPRVRYDTLMNFCWLNLFPLSFFLFIFSLI